MVKSSALAALFVAFASASATPLFNTPLDARETSQDAPNTADTNADDVNNGGDNGPMLAESPNATSNSSGIPIEAHPSTPPRYFTVKEATLSPGDRIDPSKRPDDIYANIQIFGLLADQAVSINATGFFREGGANALEVAYPLTYDNHIGVGAEFYEGNATAKGAPSSRSNGLIFGYHDTVVLWDMDIYNEKVNLWTLAGDGVRYLKQPVRVLTERSNASYHDALYNRTLLYFSEDFTQITDGNGHVLDQYHV